MSGAALELTGISKHFGGIAALRGAGLEVLPGEVHGLVGENGAGKSTLINIATGLFPPDGGGIRLEGAVAAFASPRDAAARGIIVVHQEAELFAQLSIAENMLLAGGLVRGAAGLIDWPGTYREAATRVRAMGESFDVRHEAGGLPVARRTMAEIAAAVAARPKVLFLDEPTSSLTRHEIDNLFAQIRRLKEAGVGIVYVSHRLEEVLHLCDRVTIMRDGETVETRPAAGLTMERIVAAMVGRSLEQIMVKRPVPIGGVRLRVKEATDAAAAFRDVSLELRAGEILGLYGFVGAGRSEFAQALFGMRPLSGGSIEVDAVPVRAGSPRQAVGAGVAYLPEDRLVQGVFRGHALRSNASVTVLPRLATATLVRAGRERRLAEEVVQGMHVRAASIEQPIGTLSGGNQQKVVFGRWRAADPKVLLLDEPTRGVDVGAKAEIHRLICDLAENGAAVLLISSELPEVMAMSDRVAVFSEGRLTGVFDPRRDGEEAIASAAVPRSSPEAGVSSAGSGGVLLRLARAREIGLLAFILLLGGVMAALKPEAFATSENFFDILASAALPAIMAQGAMLIICAGGIDISVGSMVGLVGALAALAAKAGVPAPLCLLMAVGLGVGMSLVNAGTSLIARIHPIIVTLAGLSIYRGAMRIVTGGSEVMLLPDSYRALADGRIAGIPKLCYYVVGVTILAHVFLRYTLTGRRILALGNSESAARLIGLSKTRLTLLVFTISGALVGLTAVLTAGYYGKVQSNTGAGLELQAIAAAVIGGTNILGGRGSAFGALLGAFLIALLYNSLILLGADAYWQNIFVGGLILAAVVTDALLQRMRSRGA